MESVESELVSEVGGVGPSTPDPAPTKKAGQSGEQRRKSRKIKVDLAELETIVDATSDRALTKEERKKLQDANQLLAELLLPPFRNNESAAAIVGEIEREVTPKEPVKGHGRGKRDAYKSAEVVQVPHRELQSGQLCGCGCGRLYKLKRPIHFRRFTGQASIEVTLYEQEQLRCNKCGEVFTAPLPPGVGPDPYDESAVTTLALSRYGLGLPMNRQALFLHMLGTPIPAATQYEVVAAGAQKLKPASDHLVELAAQGKIGYFDDTGVKILHFERKAGDERTGLFTTGVVSVHDSFKIVLLITGRDHAGENRAHLLARRDPDLPAMIQMSDALASNFSRIATAEELIALCLAHGRRNFVKIVDSFPEECRHVIRTIATVYHHDSLSQQAGHSHEERLAFHQEKSQPIMDDLKIWLDQQINDQKTESNSSLGKAIQYLRNHWQPLTLFLRVAGAPLDNNFAERVLKRVVLHRKNSLFYLTAEGAKTGDIYMSLIQTCQMNDVNSFEYLTALQRNFEAVKAAPGDWMPWTFQDTIDRMRGATAAA